MSSATSDRATCRIETELIIGINKEKRPLTGVQIGIMNYLDDEILEKGIGEIFRVSKRWIMHCEKYEKSEKQMLMLVFGNMVHQVLV